MIIKPDICYSQIARIFLPTPAKEILDVKVQMASITPDPRHSEVGALIAVALLLEGDHVRTAQG
jgi:hypothetical protein